jgi:hypothetical protein
MQKMQPVNKFSGGMQTIHRPLHGIQQIMCLLLTMDLSVVDLPFFVNGHVARMKLEREKECVCVVGRGAHICKAMPISFHAEEYLLLVR